MCLFSAGQHRPRDHEATSRERARAGGSDRKVVDRIVVRGQQRRYERMMCDTQVETPRVEEFIVNAYMRA